MSGVQSVRPFHTADKLAKEEKNHTPTQIIPPPHTRQTNNATTHTQKRVLIAQQRVGGRRRVREAIIIGNGGDDDMMMMSQPARILCVFSCVVNAMRACVCLFVCSTAYSATELAACYA